MDCINHSNIPATNFCQGCGKPLCGGCVRYGAAGQVYCQPCWTAWQSYPQQPFPVPILHTPNPSAAAALGLIPGVGAMYNGQFVKGFIHVVIFAVLCSLANHWDVFGLFIAAWIFYQSFEAFHTARAIREGQPLPDPLGLNEVGSWLNLGARQRNSWPPVAGAAQSNPEASGATVSGGSQPPYPQDQPGPYQQGPPGPGQWQRPYAPPAPGFVDPAEPPIPPFSPVPPYDWRHKEPIGAIVLIGLGLLFLMGQLDFFRWRVFEFTWPLALIALGVWLIVSRVGDSQGGRK